VAEREQLRFRWLCYNKIKVRESFGASPWVFAHITMNHNKSIFLVGIFFVVALIFGNVFWQMFNRENSDAFDKIKKEAQIGLAQGQSAGQGSTAPSASAGAAAEAPGAPATESAQAPTPSDSAKTPESETEKPKDETADWQTFAGGNSKFEFKYPADASVVPSGDLIRVSQKEKTWKMRLFSNKDKSDLSSWYTEEFSEKERKNCTLSDSGTLKVGSYETKYVNPNSGDLECTKAGYFSISSDKKNVIRLEIGDETVENVNKILATFKFLTE
jgi:hypothetical protein